MLERDDPGIFPRHPGPPVEVRYDGMTGIPKCVKTTVHLRRYLGVSKNKGTPKSSILIGFSIINHPFWGIPIFRNIHLED